jgi:hypothetical protein
MTRVSMSRPSSTGQLTDPVNQVFDGGFYFLANEFSQTPALVTEKFTVDQDGDEVNYFIGYNPRRECSKPEQARTYKTENKRLLFDFTSEFPPSFTLKTKYRFKASSSATLNEFEITKTYQKFVSGSATFQTTESLSRSDGLGTYRNVNGFVTEDPSDSDYLLFGYRAINCTVEKTDSDGDKVYLSAPSMPVKYYSKGSGPSFFRHVPSQIRFATGDGGQGLSAVLTDELFGQFQDARRWIPHQISGGVLTSDMTYGPDCPQLTPNSKIQSGFNVGSGGGLPNPTLSGFPPIFVASSCMSYKGQTELLSIHTMSIEQATLLYPMDKRGGTSSAGQITDITLVDVVNKGIGYGTIDKPFVHLDSKSGAVGLRLMTNPLGGAYHFLTDGLSNSFFSFEFPEVSEA